MARVSSNMIVGDLNNEIYTEFGLKSTEPFVDEYVIVYTGNKDHENYKRLVRFKEDASKPVKIVETPFTTFSDVRNIALKDSNYEWVLRQDADEVYPNNLMKLRPMLDFPGVVGFTFHFVHFMVDYDHYEDILPKHDVLFKKGSETHYEGRVHEQLVGRPVGNCITADFKFYHYGYCKGQREVWKRWEQYAQLEGKPDMNAKILQEAGSEDKILEHRKEKWHKFEGEHPEIIRLWIEEQRNLV